MKLFRKIIGFIGQSQRHKNTEYGYIHAMFLEEDVATENFMFFWRIIHFLEHIKLLIVHRQKPTATLKIWATLSECNPAPSNIRWIQKYIQLVMKINKHGPLNSLKMQNSFPPPWRPDLLRPESEGRIASFDHLLIYVIKSLIASSLSDGKRFGTIEYHKKQCLHVNGRHQVR